MNEDPRIDRRLEQWLETATRGLSERAASRARDEIIDHWLEELDDLQADGVDHDDAVTQILRNFGDPEQMGRSLRRADLRPWEARMVEDLRRPQSFGKPLAVVSLVTHAALIPFFIAVNWEHVGTPWWRDSIFTTSVVLLTACVFAMFWLAELLAKTDRLRPALVVSVFGTWIYYATLTIGTDVLLKGRPSFMRVFIYFLILSVATTLVMHLWPKMGRRSVS